MVFDMIALCAVVLGLLSGSWKGFSWQLAGIGSVVLGVAGGRPLSELVSAQLEEPSTFTRFLVFAICYGLISLACYLVALLLRKKLQQEDLQRLDRHLGAFLGVTHALVLGSMVTMFVIVLVPSTREPILSRPSGRVVAHVIDGVHGVLPEGVHDILHPYMHPEPVAEGAGTANPTSASEHDEHGGH